jgi:hypothetical protein
VRASATWATVAVLAAIAVAALADAFRGDPAELRPTTPRAAETTTGVPAATRLEREGVSGALYVVVRRGETCELRQLALPRLAVTTAFPLDVCLFEVSPNGREVAEARECPGGGSDVRGVLTPGLGRSFVGCAPAWMPNGTFTFVHSGEVVAARGLDCLGAVGCLHVVLPRSAVRRGISTLEQRFGRAWIAQAAWLAASRLAALVQYRDKGRSVVIWEGRRRVAGVDFLFAPDSQIVVAQGGREVLVGGRKQGGFTAFDTRSRSFSGNRVPFGDVTAVAESPNGRWLALARPGNVCIHPRRDGRLPVACLPVDAVDLAWR